VQSSELVVRYLEIYPIRLARIHSSHLTQALIAFASFVF